MLEIDGFDERLESLSHTLGKAISRIEDLVKRADTYKRLDTEERREAIRNIFKKIQNSDYQKSRSVKWDQAMKKDRFKENAEDLDEVE